MALIELTIKNPSLTRTEVIRGDETEHETGETSVDASVGGIRDLLGGDATAADDGDETDGDETDDIEGTAEESETDEFETESDEFAVGMDDDGIEIDIEDPDAGEADGGSAGRRLALLGVLIAVLAVVAAKKLGSEGDDTGASADADADF
ncbi:hypothetical protein ACNS7O_13210 [Haloferacaceae archaeon DSL9]